MVLEMLHLMEDGNINSSIYYPYQYYFGETTYQRTFGLEYTFISGKHDLVTNLTNTHIVENISINVTKD